MYGEKHRHTLLMHAIRSTFTLCSLNDIAQIREVLAKWQRKSQRKPDARFASLAIAVARSSALLKTWAA